jgi:four helix bundle protein
MAIVEEEGDESIYWIELIAEVGIMNRSRLVNLLQEANELVSIVVASIKTAKKNRNNPQSEIKHPKSHA